MIGRDSDDDLPKVFGFGGLERHRDPLGVRAAPCKVQVFEFCGFRQIKRGRHVPTVCVRGLQSGISEP